MLICLKVTESDSAEWTFDNKSTGNNTFASGRLDKFGETCTARRRNNDGNIIHPGSKIILPSSLTANQSCRHFLHTYNTNFLEEYGRIPFEYRFVSNGKIAIKHIFSCIHQTSIKLNDKFIAIEEQILLSPRRFPISDKTLDHDMKAMDRLTNEIIIWIYTEVKNMDFGSQKYGFQKEDGKKRENKRDRRQSTTKMILTFSKLNSKY